MQKRNVSAYAVLVLIAVAAACAPAPAPAAPPQDMAADEAKLKTDALIWFEHYANVNADGMANLYTDDALLMPPGAAAVTGRAAIKTFLGDDAAKSKAAGISLKNGSVTGAAVSGDMGWISGNYTVVDAKGTVLDSGSYLSVHHRTNGQWLYIRDTWNSDRPPAPPAPKK
jgi:ketosteroid isomerase-like protein